VNLQSRTPQDLELRLLVLRCQAGDEHAFVRLMQRFGGRTLAHLRGLIGDDADDAQQEVWLTVFRRVKDLADPGAFRTWLFRLTRNRALDYLRAQRRAREMIDETSNDAVIAAIPVDDAPIAEPLLAGILERLPPLQREAIALRYQDGLSYAEIALVTGAAIGTVRSRLHAAKQHLEQLLKETTNDQRGGGYNDDRI
jgi:RNA polymerase sigma-70 factor (ECF subfamily)